MSSHDAPSGDQPRPDSAPDPADRPTAAWSPPPGAAAPLPPIGDAPSSYASSSPPVETGSRRNLLLVLGAAIALVAVLAIGLFVFLNQGPTAGAGATRDAYGYLPADTAMAFELRIDMPAGQRQEFVRFVTRFPQFTDAGQAERQLDQMLNEAIATTSSGMANYNDDIKPWFAGWIVAGGSPSNDPMGSAPPPFVAILGSTNREAAEPGTERLRGAGNWSSQPGPGGATIWTNNAAFGGSSYAVTDDAVVFASNTETVRAALDLRTGNGESLLAKDSFESAMGRQPAGRMAMFWLDYVALAEALDEAGSGSPFGNPFDFECPGVVEPRSVSGSMYMRDGRAHLDLFLENEPGGQPAQMRDPGLAQRLPADTFMYFSAHDVGANVTSTLDCLRDAPMIGDQLEDLEVKLGQPIDQLISWAGDSAMGVRYDGTRVTGGLVIKVTDQARAIEAMGQLRGLITAAGGGPSVVEEDYNGARMVVFQFQDEFGSMKPPGPEPSFAYAFAGDLLVIGMDASFTRAVIDTQAGGSLNSDAKFRRAIDAAGGPTNAGALYVDFETAMSLFESTMDDPTGGMFEPTMQEVRAVIGSLESLVIAGRVEGDVTTTRVVLSTREP